MKHLNTWNHQPNKGGQWLLEQRRPFGCLSKSSRSLTIYGNKTSILGGPLWLEKQPFDGWMGPPMVCPKAPKRTFANWRSIGWLWKLPAVSMQNHNHLGELVNFMETWHWWLHVSLVKNMTPGTLITTIKCHYVTREWWLIIVIIVNAAWHWPSTCGDAQHRSHRLVCLGGAIDGTLRKPPGASISVSFVGIYSHTTQRLILEQIEMIASNDGYQNSLPYKIVSCYQKYVYIYMYVYPSRSR